MLLHYKCNVVDLETHAELRHETFIIQLQILISYPSSLVHYSLLRINFRVTSKSSQKI